MLFSAKNAGKRGGAAGAKAKGAAKGGAAAVPGKKAGAKKKGKGEKTDEEDGYEVRASKALSLTASACDFSFRLIIKTTAKSVNKAARSFSATRALALIIWSAWIRIWKNRRKANGLALTA